MDVLWKTVTVLLNHHFTSAIRFHDVLHGFWAGRWTETAALEAKLIQPIMAMREAFLYNIFLGL